MTFLVHFQVEGNPVAKGRPRFTRKGHTYTPTKTRDYEEVVKDAARHAMGSTEPLEAPVALAVVVFVPIPASWSKKRQEAAKNKDIYPTTRPDSDNYAKLVMDACNGILFVDDCQVVDLHVSKNYCTFPRIEVTLVEKIK